MLSAPELKGIETKHCLLLFDSGLTNTNEETATWWYENPSSDLKTINKILISHLSFYKQGASALI